MSSTDDILSRILSDYECPVCYEYMCRPIFSCQNGHSLCGACMAMMFKCPQCRDENFRRDLAVEKICAELIFPCKFKYEGCQFVFNCDSLADKKAHDTLCRYDTTRSCPLAIDPCKWNGKFEDMPRHIEECHSALITPHSWTIDFDTLADGSDRKISFIHKFSNYFQVIVVKKDIFVKITTQFVGCYDDAKFVYSVKFRKDWKSGATVIGKCKELISAETNIHYGEYIETIEERFAEVTIYQLFDKIDF